MRQQVKGKEKPVDGAKLELDGEEERVRVCRAFCS